MKKLIAILIFVHIVFFLAGCNSTETGGNSSGGEGHLAELKEAGVVRIGFANEKPYAYKDENGELKGAAVEIAKEVFKELGVPEVEAHLAEFKQLIPGLQAGKYDVITAAMAIQPNRCERVDFGEPEIQYGEGLIVKKGNPSDLQSYTDIANNPDITVAVMSGATEIGFLQEMGVSKDQILEVPDIPASFAAVESERADATTGTEMTVKMALESSNQTALEFVSDFEQPDIEGVPSYGAAAFRQDDDELREAYNEVLTQLKEDGKILDLVTPSGFGEGNIVPLDLTTEQLCQG